MNSLAEAEDSLVSLRGRIDETAGQIRQIDEDVARKVREFKEE